MALDLRIAGPGLDVSRRLLPGDPALVLGRDADCTVCLPDPERNVSRRHLSVWNDGDALHFHVLSSVNGVEMGELEIPPGARGVLPAGQALTLSAFQLAVQPVPDADTIVDPWADFEREASAMTATMPLMPGDAVAEEDDPFGDWGMFGDTFAPNAAGGALQADGLAPATDLRPFAAGLGLDPERLAALTQGELETIGRLTRIALSGLLQSLQAATGSRQALRAEEGTTVQPRDANPLRMDMPIEARLQYLLGGKVAAAGFMPPDRAVADVVNELVAHQQAMAEAVPQAVESVLQEFDPEALKARLLRGGPRLFEAARAWEAFVRDHAEQARQPGQRVQQLVDRHFASAYVRALVRVKRDTGQRRR
ncbi:MAG: type VI secretion system-associated FHA domain protein TagH [Comamonadaceae bacterium]|nr:MAG: type VI secretion system-associated FHA domain protein TagH [Comamonadaceae bacterium]